ncbi:MAG: response regulator receiver modulated diguanylate cyclase/phosphodiesterase with sensor(s) [Frankiales bacterium]|nr:response regulator receiver modulated diguanylate cyclase/phosphodiesterase with sensor(s) [Frankiales bacterium]
MVEDDPDHAFLVRRQLRERLLPELDIVQLDTAAAATARLRAGDVRCVVLDLSLPDAKGLEAVRLVRAAAPGVPVVVLTGLDSDEVGRQAVELGAQDYLVKGQHGADALSRSVVFALERAKRQAAEQRSARVAEQLQLVLEASADGICLVDAGGRLSFVNRAAAVLLGVPPDVLSGQSLHDFHRCPTSDCSLSAQLRSGVEVDAGEQGFRSAAGEDLVLVLRTRPMHQGTVVNLTDVTARRRAQDALVEREAQLVDAQRLARLGSWDWDLVTDEVLWSEEMYRVTGLSASEVPLDGRAFVAYSDLVPVAERGELRALFAGRPPGGPTVEVVHRIDRPDGERRWVQCRATVSEALVPGIDGAPLRIVGTVQDITEQKVAEDALAHQALHDDLTGLPNRALLLDRLGRALEDPRRGVVAVVFMDLDRFKWVNDSIGHSAGDDLLVGVAERLGSVMRASDTLARFGGDEFVLICDRLTDERQLFEVVARLTAALEAPISVNGREVVVTASMGLAVAEVAQRVEPEVLIRDADTAMYRAKDNGRARCEIFDEAMRARASERMEVQVDLRLAIERGEITPWFQPVVDVRTGHVVGCEALARWEHPVKGLLSPDAFIPHAEETGAIVPLGSALLLESCRQVQAWNQARPAHEALTVAVNVSSRQLGSPELVATVRDALRTTGLPARLLCLEVTESVVMQDVVMSGAVLGQLRELGVRTAVDDFGTGFSSLAYLLSLPVDLLKIDRSFVRALDPESGPAVAIVRAIAALADALGLRVLAEGVETVEQLAELDGLGVQHGQGFLWGRPVPAAEATWAATWSAPALPRARVSPDVPVVVP